MVSRSVNGSGDIGPSPKSKYRQDVPPPNEDIMRVPICVPTPKRMMSQVILVSIAVGLIACASNGKLADKNGSPPPLSGKADGSSSDVQYLGAISDGQTLQTPALPAHTNDSLPRFFGYTLTASRGDNVAIEIQVSPYPSPEMWLYDADDNPVEHAFAGAASEDHIARINKRVSKDGEYSLIFYNYGDRGGTFQVSYSVTDNCSTLTTCADAGAHCSSVPDGCGGTLLCLDDSCAQPDGEPCTSSSQCMVGSLCDGGYQWSSNYMEGGTCDSCSGCGGG
jgi:hypothetical protein